MLLWLRYFRKTLTHYSQRFSIQQTYVPESAFELRNGSESMVYEHPCRSGSVQLLSLDERVKASVPNGT